MYMIHLVFFGSLALGIYVISNKIILSAALAAGLGILKEVCDGMLHMGNCDIMDVVFNFLGIAIFLSIGTITTKRR